MINNTVIAKPVRKHPEPLGILAVVLVISREIWSHLESCERQAENWTKSRHTDNVYMERHSYRLQIPKLQYLQIEEKIRERSTNSEQRYSSVVMKSVPNCDDSDKGRNGFCHKRWKCLPCSCHKKVFWPKFMNTWIPLVLITHNIPSTSQWGRPPLFSNPSRLSWHPHLFSA